MDREEIICLFDKISPSKRNDVDAPHKTLLVLFSIKKLLLDGIRLVPYIEVDECLKALLEDFNPTGSTTNTNEPFWRLQYDKVWEVINSKGVILSPENMSTNDKGGVNKGDLREEDAIGGFIEEIGMEFQNDPTLVVEIIQMMLCKVFPDSSIHNEVIQTVGIESLLDNS